MMDPRTKKRLKRAWNVTVAVCSAAAAWAALTLPEYAADLGKAGVFVLIGVRAIDFALNRLPTLIPDDTDEAGA